jgi:SNF2 family DNA or RNA helicase
VVSEEEVKYKPKTKPFPHQARGTIRAARARNYALFFEPRCGKSKAALDTVGIHALAGRVSRVLILAPRITLSVWEGQIRQHYPFGAQCETFTDTWDWPHDHLVTRFFLASREETFRRTTSPQHKYLRPKQDELERWNPDLIIVDESHEYKRASSVSAQDLWRLVRRMRQRDTNSHKPWVILLSGTPTPKGWHDLFAQFRLMDEGIFGTSKAEFEEEYVVYGHGRRKWTILRYRNERRLQRKIRDHSLSISAADAGLANEASYQNLPVALPPNVKKMYLELANEFLTEWEGGVISAKNAGVKRLRLLQITGGFATGGEYIHGAKLVELKAYLSLLMEQDESVVVYSRFTPEVIAAHACLESLGFRSYRVDGSTSDRVRREATKALAQRPPQPCGISFQYQAGSRAIELVGAAETVYYSTPDGWVDYRQTAARTTGPNQSRPVRYTHLICPGTVDVSVVRSLQRKEDIHDAMMRDPRGFLTGLIQ